MKKDSCMFFTMNVILVMSCASVNAIGDPIKSTVSGPSSPYKELHFAAAGDWGCKAAAQRTADLIKSRNPDVVLGLGDFSYEKDTGCWFKIMSPLISKTRIVIGEHDFDTKNNSRLQVYVNRFNLSDPYYSFNYGNVHFLALSSLIPFNNQTLPYKLLRDEFRQKEFVSNDLYYASQNKSINWIIVYLYKPMYTSPSHWIERCNNVVGLDQFSKDLKNNNLPNYSFVVPNDFNNSHDTTVAYGDHWLSTFVPEIINSSIFNSTLVFITYDEGQENSTEGFGNGVYAVNGGHIPMIIVSPLVKSGFRSSEQYSHYSLLSTLEKIFNTGNLGRGDTSATGKPMLDLFRAPL